MGDYPNDTGKLPRSRAHCIGSKGDSSFSMQSTKRPGTGWMSTLKIREEGRVLTEGFEGGTGWVRVSRVSRFLTGWHRLGKGPFRTFSSLTTRRLVRHKRFLSSRISLGLVIYRNLSNQ